MSYLTSISRFEAENMSGCRNLWIARLADLNVAAFPKTIAGRINGDITFLPGKGWIKWQPIENTFGFDVNTSESQDGVIQQNNIRFKLPGFDIDEWMLNQLMLDRLVILVEDMNLVQWVFGSPQRPMMFRFNKQTATLGSGRSEYDCFFLGRPFCPRARYNVSIPVEEFDFIAEVGGELILTLDGFNLINLN